MKKTIENHIQSNLTLDVKATVELEVIAETQVKGYLWLNEKMLELNKKLEKVLSEFGEVKTTTHPDKSIFYRVKQKNTVYEHLEREKEEQIVIETGSRKALKPATYKQYRYLSEILKVDIRLRNASQFCKYCSAIQASEAIVAAKAGHKVIIQ